MVSGGVRVGFRLVAGVPGGPSWTRCSPCPPETHQPGHWSQGLWWCEPACTSSQRVLPVLLFEPRAGRPGGELGRHETRWRRWIRVGPSRRPRRTGRGHGRDPRRHTSDQIKGRPWKGWLRRGRHRSPRSIASPPSWKRRSAGPPAHHRTFADPAFPPEYTKPSAVRAWRSGVSPNLSGPARCSASLVSALIRPRTQELRRGLGDRVVHGG